MRETFAEGVESNRMAVRVLVWLKSGFMRT